MVFRLSIHSPLLIILFVAILSSYFSNFISESWATQTTLEFQSRLIFGNTTAVNDNFTLEVNDSLVVTLALVATNTTDEITHEDGIHFMSVVCPIRSPVVVFPVSNSISLYELNKSANLKEIEGVVYCQSSNISDLNSTKSINEQLVDAELAIPDNNNCKNQNIPFSVLSRIDDC
ncbi:hypothetical protein [Candidatus Nitrosocosmicus hydrocola]|uniref:hypothetical protein n=1 Tax=Candidatus Nitrosocosmicus hydrocola TaxID=1826872 RepID=UPI0011E5D880|nr:hypothetical protein [Candidatus Nitrosocosmicus hydrocola]